MFYKHKYNDEKLEDMTITVFQVSRHITSCIYSNINLHACVLNIIGKTQSENICNFSCCENTSYPKFWSVIVIIFYYWFSCVKVFFWNRLLNHCSLFYSSETQTTTTQERKLSSVEIAGLTISVLVGCTIAGVAVYFVRYEDEFLLVFRVEGRGGEDSKGWQCERAGSSGTNQSTIPGGMEVFFEGVGGDHTEFKGNRGDISRRRQQSMKWGVG